MFRIVIVEDEPPIIRSIKEKIITLDPDFKVVGEYHNGAEALLEMEIVKPHVLITDLHMPIMDGSILLEHIREQYPDIICVILSGYQDFEYARMAIRRGITDYLLKPPTDENISELLAGIKKKLMQNQSLIESEVLQHLAFANHYSPENYIKTKKLAHEYFYHASYVLLYAWIPPELQQSLKLPLLQQKAVDWLKEGERHYLISSVANEFIVLFGVHDLNEKRYLECEASLRSLPDDESVTFLLMPISGWISKIPQLLIKARKAALIYNYVGKASVLIFKEDEAVHDQRRIDLPLNHINHLLSFLRKQKQQEFEKQLITLIDHCQLPSAPRAQWIKTMQHLVQLLEAGVHPPMESGKLKSMEDEIAHAIWASDDLPIIMEHLKQILSRFFQENEEVEPNDWFNDVEEYLQKYYITHISLTELSEKFNLNPTYLSYVFKSKKNKSPLDYLIELRVEEAKRIIKEYPRLLFKDIAEQVGYPDPYYFSKLFKQSTGLTPTEFKRSQFTE